MVNLIVKHYEIEQKYKLANPANLRRKIINAGAKQITSGIQRNEYLDNHCYLKSKRLVLRLRRDNSGSFLTLKGPKLPGKFTKRVEYETLVNYAQAKSILAVLGYSPFRKYTKKRETYRLHQCIITLDQLPSRGWFAEIEGPVRQIQKLSTRLGLCDSDREERSYLAILFPTLKACDQLKKPSRKSSRKSN
jgi:predicted adenylyl cyclase CyaB